MHPRSRLPLPACLLASCLLHALVLELLTGEAHSAPGSLPGPPRPLAATLSARPLPAPPPHDDGKDGANVNAGQAATPEAGAGRGTIPRYYPADDLDDPPGIVGEPDLPDSEIADYSGGGHVLLKLLIDETGGIDKAIILARTVPEEIAESGRRKFLSARASPGRLNGRPVKSALLIEMRYAPAAPSLFPRRVLELPAESAELPATPR